LFPTEGIFGCVSHANEVRWQQAPKAFKAFRVRQDPRAFKAHKVSRDFEGSRDFQESRDRQETQVRKAFGVCKASRDLEACKGFEELSDRKVSRAPPESKALPARWAGGVPKERPVQRVRKDLSETKARKAFREPPVRRESRARRDFRVLGLMGLSIQDPDVS
jgi:hypothetical protein